MLFSPPLIFTSGDRIGWKKANGGFLSPELLSASLARQATARDCAEALQVAESGRRAKRRAKRGRNHSASEEAVIGLSADRSSSKSWLCAVSAATGRSGGGGVLAVLVVCSSSPSERKIKKVESGLAHLAKQQPNKNTNYTITLHTSYSVVQACSYHLSIINQLFSQGVVRTERNKRKLFEAIRWMAKNVKIRGRRRGISISSHYLG